MHFLLNRVAWITFLAVGLVACSSSDDDGDGTAGADSCDNVSSEGYRSFTEDGVTRGYILQLPAGYDDSAQEPLPLVINFHGNGGCANAYSEGREDGPSDLSSLADQHNFIVAYPQGVARVKGATEWDPGGSGGDDLADNDVYFTQRLIAHIGQTYPVDPDRIYAAGYSNGGMMAYGLACQLSSQIAAVGIMSGIMLDGECDTARYTPVIHFHGTEDDALPYEGNEDFRSVADVISFWVNHNQIMEPTPMTTSLNDGIVTRDTYSGGAEGSVVVLYTILGGGHVWFADEIDGETPSELLWRFLSGYRLNGM